MHSCVDTNWKCYWVQSFCHKIGHEWQKMTKVEILYDKGNLLVGVVLLVGEVKFYSVT